MALQALAEEVLAFMLVTGYHEDKAKEIFAKILMAYEEIKATPCATDDGGSLDYEAEIPLDEGFINETQKNIITAAIQRNAPVNRSIKKMEVVRPVKKDRAINDAKRVIQKYRNRSLKSQPHPLYMIVYNFQGQPVGVKKL